MKRFRTPTRPRRCNYCKAAAVVWIRYTGFIASARRQTMTCWVSACADHEGCPNWKSHLELTDPPWAPVKRNAEVVR